MNMKNTVLALILGTTMTLTSSFATEIVSSDDMEAKSYTRVALDSVKNVAYEAAWRTGYVTQGFLGLGFSALGLLAAVESLEQEQKFNNTAKKDLANMNIIGFVANCNNGSTARTDASTALNNTKSWFSWSVSKISTAFSY
jgi:hypothetical protein